MACALAFFPLGCGGGAGQPAADTTVAIDALPDTVTQDTTPVNTGWQITAVADGGRQVRAVTLPSGEVAAAFYADDGVVGASCGVAGEAGAVRIGWQLSYAASGPSGWAVEPVAVIDHLGPPRGVDLAVTDAGDPAIAGLTGEPSEQPPYCGANDLAIYTRAAASAPWSPTVVVAESNEASTGEPASDYGTVVGLWPGLAVAPDGRFAVVYKDVHAGSLQGDDSKRADLELAWQGASGWRHLAVDAGRGAGNFNSLVFDGEGRPVIVTFNPQDDVAVASARGLWAWRSADSAATWESVRLTGGGTTERPSLAWDADGGVPWVAWYDSERGLPMVAHLVDDTAFSSLADGWEVEDIGDHVFDEGYRPSVAITPSGQVAVAYYRCGRASDGLGNCQPARDAVVIAWRDAGAWYREVVDDGGAGSCGSYIALAFASGEVPVVLYQCQVPDGAGFVARLFAARGERL